MKLQQFRCFNTYSRAIFSSVTLLMLSLVSACVETELNLVPGLPTTLDESETRSLMRDLAVSISAIEDAGISDNDITEQRAIIESELDRISALISQLENDDTLQDSEQFEGQHEFVVKYLSTLGSEVELARGQAGDENADLFIAGQLAGACRGCHEKLWPDP